MSNITVGNTGTNYHTKPKPVARLLTSARRVINLRTLLSKSRKIGAAVVSINHANDLHSLHQSRRLQVNSANDVRAALHDLFRSHLRPHVYLPALLVLVAAAALGAFVREILFSTPGPGYVPSEFRTALAYKAVLSWVVSTLCGYVGGFVMGRLYQPGD
jgi:hypothetical protein